MLQAMTSRIGTKRWQNNNPRHWVVSNIRINEEGASFFPNWKHTSSAQASNWYCISTTEKKARDCRDGHPHSFTRYCNFKCKAQGRRATGGMRLEASMNSHPHPGCHGTHLGICRLCSESVVSCFYCKAIAFWLYNKPPRVGKFLLCRAAVQRAQRNAADMLVSVG